MRTFIRTTASLLFFFVPILGSSADASLSKTTHPAQLSNYLILESEISEGKYLSLNETTPGVSRYSGGALPNTLNVHPKMYTLKTTFKVAENLLADSLALYVGPSEYPFRLYLNGIELFAKGRYKNGEYNSSLRAANSVFLSKDLLRYGDGGNELVIEAYPRYETWALDALSVDYSDEVAKSVFLRNFAGLTVVQGAFLLSLTLFLYFLILSLLQRDNMSKNLLFAIICACFCLSYFNMLVHNEAMAEVPLEALSKAGLVLMSTFLLIFCLEFTRILSRLPVMKKRALLALLICVGTVGAAAVFAQPSKEKIISVFGVAMNFIIVPQLLLALITLLTAFIKEKNRLVIPLLIAFFAVVGTAIHDIIHMNAMVIPFAWLAPYGYLSYIVAIFAMLITEQSQLYRKSIQQMADLVVSQSRIENLNAELTLERDSFHRFVPTQFLQLLGRNSSTEIRLGDSSLRFLSVLFSDIRHYTGISEGMLPEQNLRYLNEYLFGMGKAIQNNQGFVDKYIGDAILALFPWDGERLEATKTLAADIALSAAMEMKEMLDDFNGFMKGKSLPEIDIGVGINTGEVILGTVGSETRLDTTVIGDTVNVSSRLESLTKYYQTRFLVSEQTVKSLVAPGKYQFRMIDHICVAGRQQGIRIYEFLDENDSRDSRKMETSSRLEDVMELYRNREFAEAENRFREMSETEPSDHVFTLYADRCAALVASPPPPDWDGIYRFHSK